MLRFQHCRLCAEKIPSVADSATVLRVGFNIVWSVLYERSKYNTLQTMLKRTYVDDPLSGRQRVGRSLKLPLVDVVTVQRSLFTHMGCSDAVSCR